MTRSTFLLVVCVAIAWYLSLGLGCIRSGFTLAPVSGMITMDGHPMEAAYVGFQPVGGDLDNQSDQDLTVSLMRTDVSFGTRSMMTPAGPWWAPIVCRSMRATKWQKPSIPPKSFREC